MTTLFFAISLIFSYPTSHAQIDPQLKAIADTYDEKYFYYEYFLLSYQERLDVFEKFKADLQVISQMPQDVRKSRLGSDLYYYINSQIHQENACESYYWNLEPYYNGQNALDFRDLITQMATIDEFEKMALIRMDQVKSGLINAVERMDKMLAEQKIPPALALEPFVYVLDFGENPLELGFAAFEKDFSSLTCAYCKDIDIKALREKYNLEIQPAMQLAVEKFNLVYPAATMDTPLVMPPSIQKDCYDATLAGIYSELTGPMILKKGEFELLRAEREMLDLIYQMGEPLTIPLSISAMIEQTYLKMSADPKYQIKDDAGYMKIYDQLEIRMKNELPKITSASLAYPLLYELHLLDPYFPKSAWYSLDKEKLQGTFSTMAPPTNGYLTFELAWLFFHEGIPGHHLEQSISYQAALSSQTLFEKNKDFSPYIEGWGLYVEELALDLGFYQNPEEKLAFFDAVRLRALRLILAYRYYYDGWSNAQVTQLTNEHLFGGEKDAADTIARPRHWSAQAVGYMVGKTILLSMKNSAHRILGTNCFTLQEYNDSFLLNGNVHLDTLVSQTAKWIQTKKCYRGLWTADQIEDQLRLDIRSSFGVY